MKAAALLLLVPVAVSAGDFDARVRRAEAAIATRAGYAYDMALVPAIHAATLPCTPPGRRAANRAESFAAVADVMRDGRVRNVQVQPSTPLSQCFAKHLAAKRLQAPPVDRHPILIRIRDRF